MDFALYHRSPYDRALDDRWLDDWLYNSALDDRGLYYSGLHHRGLDNRRLHDVGRLWGPGLVGLLAVLLHLDGAAGGLGRGVGDRLLLNPRLRLPVVLLAREAAGGDGAADAAERQDDEEYDDDSDAASAAGMAIILGLVFQAPLDAVVADLPGFAPVGIDR